MSNKLHELLALEQDRKNKANQKIGLAQKVFTKNDVHFDGMIKKYVPLEEDAEQVPDETKEMAGTIKNQIEEVMQTVITALNATLSKEETNASGMAKTELKVDNTEFGDFSATSLLALEGQLNKLLSLYKDIPTLDVSKKWNFDTQTEVYKTEPEVRFRSVKRPKVIVKYEATEKHPAQTELMNLDFQVGKYETTYYSGKISVAQKNELIQRIEQLIEAVKVARAKANNVDVKPIKVGEKIFEYLHKGIL